MPPGFASHPEIFEGNRLLLLLWLLCDLNRKNLAILKILKETSEIRTIKYCHIELCGFYCCYIEMELSGISSFFFFLHFTEETFASRRKKI